MRSLLLRPVRAVLLVLALSFATSLVAVGWLDWRTWERLNAIEVAVRHVHDLQGVGLKLTRLLGETAAPDAGVDAIAMDDLRADLRRFLNPRANLSPDSTALFRQAIDALSDPTRPPARQLVDAHTALREANYAESGAESLLLDRIGHDTRVQAILSISGLVVLPSIGLLAFVMFRERLFRSIGDLRHLLTRLADGEFTTVDARGVDPMLLPLFNNYNHVVGRLDELERAHRKRADSLEHDVRAATQALLEQQVSLARAERLAAVGELSATVAHELRNPLASVQMALGNLRSEIRDPGLLERIDLVGLEVQRMTRLLNDLLGAARQSPEPKRRVDLATVVGELLQLTRYQTPGHIALANDIPPGIAADVPVDGLRQALLNLLLNAVQSLGDQPGSVRLVARRDNGSVRIAVIDSGPGFPPSLLRDGVRPFASGRESGTGLGLTLALRFARDLGGELLLANERPIGARAELVLPGAHE